AMASQLEEELAGGESGRSGGGLEAGGLMDNIDPELLPAGSTVEPYEDGTSRGNRVTMPFASPDEIPQLLSAVEALSDADASPDEDQTFEDFKLERDGEGWRFE